MIILFKKACFLLLIGFFWLLPLSFINFNNGFFGLENLSLYTYIILWIINILSLSLSTFNIFKDEPINNQYLLMLIINYLISPLFNLFLFNFQNILYAFLSLIIIFILALYLFYETKKLDKKAAILIIPYLVLNLYLIITLIYIISLN